MFNVKNTNFKMLVCDELGINVSDINEDKILELNKINASSISMVYSLEGIEKAQNLQTLKIENSNIEDISPVSMLHKLKSMDIRDAIINDISDFLKNPLLEFLNFNWTSLHRFPLRSENKSKIPYTYLLGTFFARSNYTMRQRKICEEIILNESAEIARISLSMTTRALPFAVNYFNNNALEEIIIDQISNPCVKLQYLKELVQMPQVNGGDLISEYGSTKARKWLMEKQLKMR